MTRPRYKKNKMKESCREEGSERYREKERREGKGRTEGWREGRRGLFVINGGSNFNLAEC